MRLIAIASDHAGFKLKEKLKSYLVKKGCKVKDFGTTSADPCDYPEFASKLARNISAGTYRQGILICKTGIGSSIVANRFPGVRAALCYNAKVARLSRAHNDSNVLILGADFVNTKSATSIVGIWLKTKFQGGRHLRRLNKIKKIERACLPVLEAGLPEQVREIGK